MPSSRVSAWGLPQHRLAQRYAVHRTILHSSRKRRFDRAHRASAARLHPVHRGIGIENRYAGPAKRRGRRGFAHTDTAGQPEDDHRAGFSIRFTWPIVRRTRLTLLCDRILADRPRRIVAALRPPLVSRQTRRESRDRLMQQHAQTFDAAQPTGTGGSEQGRFQRHIDVVRNNQRRRCARKVQVERCHARSYREAWY